MNRAKGPMLAALILLGLAIAPIAAAPALGQEHDEPVAIIPHGQDRPPNPPRSPAEAARAMTVPPGFRVSVFASGLNQPTGIAFQGSKSNFTVYVLESGHGLPSICNEQGSWPGGVFDPANPFTPDVLVFDQSGNKVAGPLFKPTASGGWRYGGSRS